MQATQGAPLDNNDPQSLQSTIECFADPAGHLCFPSKLKTLSAYSQCTPHNLNIPTFCNHILVFLFLQYISSTYSN